MNEQSAKLELENYIEGLIDLRSRDFLTFVTLPERVRAIVIEYELDKETAQQEKYLQRSNKRTIRL